MARTKLLAGDDCAIDLEMTISEARRQKEVALARLRQIEVAAREGVFVRVDDALKHNERVYGTIRSTLLASPGKYAPTFTNLSSFAQAQARLDELVREVLTNMIEACEQADAEAEAEEAV